MDEKRMQEIFADEAFVKELLSLETPEAVQAALKEKGIELSREEVEEIGKALLKVVEAVSENGELSMESLDEVAGGVLSTGAQVVVNLVIQAAKPAIIPALVATGAAAAAVGAFFKRW